MTQTSVNVSQVRDNLSEILSRVKFGKETVTIEKKGKPYAVMISPDQYAAFQQQARGRLGSVIRKIQSRNKNVDEEQLDRDVTKAVEQVRQELYERGE